MDWIGLKKSFSNPFLVYHRLFKTLNSFSVGVRFSKQSFNRFFLACYLVKCPTAKDDWAS
ncbi:hypothetical protein HPHPP26_1595 [Helicobacter pylori Hp P-26]|nr:hypothetical protein HPHPP26_1595 [Helicobacter pylori Hp P-26]